MSYGGLMEDWKDQAEAEHAQAMKRILGEFNKLGLNLTEEQFVNVMKAARVTCTIETKNSKVGFGDLSVS